MTKFIKIAIGIFTILFSVLLGFKMILGEHILASERYSVMNSEDGFYIEYKESVENEDGKAIVVTVKNNSKDYISINNLELSFENNINSIDNVKFQGILKEEYDNLDGYNRRYGVDPGEQSEYIFIIPKGIDFDSSIIDLNRIKISYNISYYKFRTGDNSFFLGTSSSGGTNNVNIPEIFN